MPVIQISMLEGRGADDKRTLVGAVTDAVTESLGVGREQVRVLIYEVPPGSWAVGGTTKEDERG